MTPQPCVQGFFCLSGDDNRENGEPVPCPRGTFGNRDGLKKESQCSDCSPGRYCDQEGLRNVSGLCASGYWCKRRAITDSPGGVDDYGACPPGGYYCEEGSSAPQRCPAGRYARPGRDKLKSANECDVCPPGYYCAYGNQTQPTGTCAPGYYCVSRSPVREPLGDVYGGKCFPGYKCPEGSSYPEPCEAGTYNNETGRSSCLDCPPGFFCTMNTTVPVECPSGYYCPINSKTATAHPCPAGTFNNLTARSALQDCQPCTPGSYCDKSGKDSENHLSD